MCFGFANMKQSKSVSAQIYERWIAEACEVSH